MVHMLKYEDLVDSLCIHFLKINTYILYVKIYEDLVDNLYIGPYNVCTKIWPSGVSPKRTSKLQLRGVVLRSVGHYIQKL